MDEYAPLMMLGVRVRAVRELDECVIWSEAQQVLFVDESLSPAQRRNIASQMTERLLSA